MTIENSLALANNPKTTNNLRSISTPFLITRTTQPSGSDGTARRGGLASPKLVFRQGPGPILAPNELQQAQVLSASRVVSCPRCKGSDKRQGRRLRRRRKARATGSVVPRAHVCLFLFFFVVYNSLSMVIGGGILAGVRRAQDSGKVGEPGDAFVAESASVAHAPRVSLAPRTGGRARPRRTPVVPCGGGRAARHVGVP
jgi:hypothetical protein